MKLPISVIILTFNEEHNIKNCLESVYGWADEIIIIDSGSADKTIEIAKRYTDRIYSHPFKNYADQRNWAQDNLAIKNNWVFHLDADERVERNLVSQLGRALYVKIDLDGFLVSRKTIFRGRWIKHGGHYPVYHLRIFKKNKGRCEERLYDQHFTTEGTTAELQGDIINIIDSDVCRLRERQGKWAHLEALEILTGSNKKTGMRSGEPIEKRKWLKNNVYYKLPLFIRPCIYYFYRYIFRLGFLDGGAGLVFHFWQGFWFRFLIDLKIYDLKKER